MPHFRLVTNIARSKIPTNFLKDLTSVLSKTVGKPENKFVCTIVPDQIMTRGGSSDPCATASLMSIGKLGPNENLAHSKVIFDYIYKELGIPKDRMIIEFRDVKAFEIGFDGSTIQELEKPK